MEFIIVISSVPVETRFGRQRSGSNWQFSIVL
jgi:hypothetical protein